MTDVGLRGLLGVAGGVRAAARSANASINALSSAPPSAVAVLVGHTASTAKAGVSSWLDSGRTGPPDT